MSNIKTKAKAPTLQIIPKEHFLVKGLREAFDLSVLSTYPKRIPINS